MISGSPSSFGWTAADIDRLEDLDVIVAADGDNPNLSCNKMLSIVYYLFLMLSNI